MSSTMLEQAVIDAQSLREAAIKSAEHEVLNKYSNEIKNAVDTLLEQDEDALGIGIDPLADDEEVEREEIVDAIPMKAVEGEEVCPCPEESEEIELDLDALKAAVDAAGEEEMALDLGDEGEMAPDLGDEEEMMFETTEKDLLSLLEEDVQTTKGHFSDNPELEDKSTTKAHVDYESGEAEEGLFEDSEGEETYHYGEDEGDDHSEEESMEDHVAAIDHHLDALKKDMGYDEEHEDRDEEGTHFREGNDDLDEEIEIDETKLQDAIAEILKVDVENVPRGDLGTTHPTKAQQVHAVEVALAAEADTSLSEEEEKLRKMIGDLQEQVKSLKTDKNSLLKEYKDLKSIVLDVSKKFEKINLSNAKLNYTNRVLKSYSLNERQKEKIVEAILKAKTITESKVIFETLSESVKVPPTAKSPRNLTEALNSNNKTLILKSNKKEQVSNSQSTIDRMKRLAGII